MTALSALGHFVATSEFVTGAAVPIALSAAKSYGCRRERRRTARTQRAEFAAEVVLAVAAFLAFMVGDQHSIAGRGQRASRTSPRRLPERWKSG